MAGDYKAHAAYLKKVCDEVGIVPIQAHTPFPIHKEEPGYDQKMLEVTKKCIEICGIMGIKNCVIHPWNNWTAKENKDNFFSLLLPVAIANHVTICTENMFNWEKDGSRARPAACSSPESFIEHVDIMNSPNFKACLDIGHTNMFTYLDPEYPEKFIRALGSRLACFHIHDNDGVRDWHRPIFMGTVRWGQVASAIKAIHYEGDLVSEIAERNNLSLEGIIHYHGAALEGLKKFRQMILEAE